MVGEYYHYLGFGAGGGVILSLELISSRVAVEGRVEGLGIGV